MAAEVEPPELARLLDFAERPRVGDWSLRSALTRYAQPQPQRVSDVLELVRWLEFALRPQLKAVERDGAAYCQALQSGDGSRPEPVLELLRQMAELDRLGDVLAAWADDPHGTEPPDAAVDAVTSAVGGRMTELGVPREERQRPPRTSRG